MTREQTIKEIRKAVNRMRKYQYNNVCGYVNINDIHLSFLNWDSKPVLFFEFDQDMLYIRNGARGDYRATIILSIQYSDIEEIF